MTILCVSHVVPWPGTHGNEIRLQRLLLWLRGQGYRIILVITAADVQADHIAVIRRHCDRLELPCLSTPTHPVGRVLDRLRAGIGALRAWVAPGAARQEGGPMQTIAEAVCPVRVGSLVRHLALQEDVDIYVAYYAFALRALSHVARREQVVCDTVEVFSMVRTDAAGDPIEPLLSFSRAEEREMLLTSGHIVAIQQAEADYLAQLVPERPVVTVGLDYDVPPAPGRPSEAEQVIGIVGSSNLANVRGVHAFLDRSWPLIRARVPGVRLRVAGGLGAVLREQVGAAALDDVETMGWIEDVSAVYRGVRLVVNPVQTGTGLKVKTVEALAHCRPVVTYAIGCEGLGPDAAESVCVVDEASAMADACVTLLLDPNRCDQMGRAAGRFAAAALSTERVYAPLRELLDTIHGRRR